MEDQTFEPNRSSVVAVGMMPAEGTTATVVKQQHESGTVAVHALKVRQDFETPATKKIQSNILPVHHHQRKTSASSFISSSSSSTSPAPTPFLAFPYPGDAPSSPSLHSRGTVPAQVSFREAGASTTIPLTPAKSPRAAFAPNQTPSSPSAHQDIQALPPVGKRPVVEPAPRGHTRASPSYEKFLTARRRSKPAAAVGETYDPSLNPLQQKSLLTRFTWTLEQAFGGLPASAVTEISIQRAQAKQVSVAGRRPSVSDHRRNSSASSIQSFYSKDYFDSSLLPGPGAQKVYTSTTKPFANRRPPQIKTDSSNQPARHELSTVREEAAQDSTGSRDALSRNSSNSATSIPHHNSTPSEDRSPDTHSRKDSDTPSDDMDLVRSLSKRISRSDSPSSLSFKSPPPRRRPVISLPQLIHTTNSFANEDKSKPMAGQDRAENASRSQSASSASSSGYSSSPSTPTSDSPASTHASSVSSPFENSTPYQESFSIAAPNHLTRYFAAAENKDNPTITIVSDSAPVPAPPPRRVREYTQDAPPPLIPARAPSHSKREHLRLARRRVRASADLPSTSANAPPHHPVQGSFPAKPPSAYPPPSAWNPEFGQLREMNEKAEEPTARDSFFGNPVVDYGSNLREDDYYQNQRRFKACSLVTYTRMLEDLEASRWDE